MSYTNLTKPTPDTSLKDAVDEMGMLKAQICELENRYEELKQRLVAAEVTQLDGSLFRVKVSNFTVHQVDWRGLVSDLKPPQELINHHTTLSKRQRVTVTARSS